MTRSRIDTCLFTYTSGCTILWLAVWVDDVVIVDNSEALRDRFISAISAKFPIEDTPTLDWVLGIKVTRDRAARKIILSQSLYVKDLVQKFAGHLKHAMSSMEKDGLYASSNAQITLPDPAH